MKSIFMELKISVCFRIHLKPINLIFVYMSNVLIDFYWIVSQICTFLFIYWLPLTFYQSCFAAFFDWLLSVGVNEMFLFENSNKNSDRLIRVKTGRHKSKYKEKDIVIDHVDIMTEKNEKCLLSLSENGVLHTLTLNNLTINEGWLYDKENDWENLKLRFMLQDV